MDMLRLPLFTNLHRPHDCIIWGYLYESNMLLKMISIVLIQILSFYTKFGSFIEWLHANPVQSAYCYKAGPEKSSSRSEAIEKHYSGWRLVSENILN